MKYYFTNLHLFIKKFKDALLLLLVLGVLVTCTKDKVSTTPTPPVVIIPPVEVGRVTITTGTPVVLSNTSVSFSGNVTIVAPATVTSSSMLISWYVDTLSVAQNETVNSLSYTKTNCIPGTKYTVKAFANSSVGIVSGNESFKETPGFHIGQTFNGFKVWDVWSNADSAHQIGNLLADKYAYGCEGVNVPGTFSEYGTGMSNSLKIKAICPASAANLCLNDTALGVGSYLGSKGDWIRFFENRTKANVTLFSSVWSSTQYSPIDAWMLRSLDGFPLINSKMVNTSPIFLGPCVYAFKKVGK